MFGPLSPENKPERLTPDNKPDRKESEWNWQPDNSQAAARNRILEATNDRGLIEALRGSNRKNE